MLRRLHSKNQVKKLYFDRFSFAQKCKLQFNIPENKKGRIFDDTE